MRCRSVGLCYDGPNAVAHAIGYATHYSRSRDAVIRVYDEAGNVIETHQMRMKEKLALHSAAELRQKAREWLAKSAVNRIREDPEGAYAARSASGSLGE